MSRGNEDVNMWQYNGSKRPPFADTPRPDQESVWDFPRPPALERTDRHVEVRSGDTVIARTDRAWRVLETASPPTYYVAEADLVEPQALVPVAGSSFCEWKGTARYWALRHRADEQTVGWSYASPNRRFAPLEGCFSFYPAHVACFVDGERVQPQPGGFYGGWVTRDLAGPWKGEPGTGHW